MSTFVGADVTALRVLAAQLTASAEELESLIGRLGSSVNTAKWRGPDSERFRSDWNQRYSRMIRNTAFVLRSASEAARTNAGQQETASAADGSSGNTRLGHGGGIGNGALPQSIPGMNYGPIIDPSHVTPAQIFELSRIAPDFQIGLWTAGDLAKMLPVSGIGDVLDVRDIADKLSHGEVPLHEMVGVASGAFKSMDTPVTYLIGANLAVWDSVAKAAAKADFGDVQIATNLSYIQNHPVEAIGGAAEALVGFLPELISDVKPGWKLF